MHKVAPKESEEDKKRRLCFAARVGEIEVVKQLFAEGLDPNCIFEGNGYMTTPLESAIGGNQEEMMKFLIDQGADPSLEFCGGKSYHACFGVSKWSYENRLKMIEILYTKKPEMAEEIAKYITGRISYLGREGLLDETINSEKSQAIINKLGKINQDRLKGEENLKELVKQTKETLGLDEVSERRDSSDETKSGSSAEEVDPNHKNPASKVRPNPSQSSPIVPVVTNSGCVIS